MEVGNLGKFKPEVQDHMREITHSQKLGKRQELINRSFKPE